MGVKNGVPRDNFITHYKQLLFLSAIVFKYISKTKLYYHTILDKLLIYKRLF